MTCTISHIITDGVGRTTTKGSHPAKPCRWDVSVWLQLPTGEKHTHSFTVGNATAADLIPLVQATVDGLIAEGGNLVVGAGWIANGRGQTKHLGRSRRRK